MSSQPADDDRQTVNRDDPAPLQNLPLENTLIGRGVHVDEVAVSPTGGAYLSYYATSDDYDLPTIVSVFREVVDVVNGPVVLDCVDPDTKETRLVKGIKAGWLRQHRGGQITSEELFQRILNVDERDADALFCKAFEGTGIAFFNHLDRKLEEFGCELTDADSPDENTVELTVAVSPAALNRHALHRGPVAECLPVLVHQFAYFGIKFVHDYVVAVEGPSGDVVDEFQLPDEEIKRVSELMRDEDAGYDAVDDALMTANVEAVDRAETTDLDYIDEHRAVARQMRQEESDGDPPAVSPLSPADSQEGGR